MSTGYARSVEEARLLAHAILNLGQLHKEHEDMKYWKAFRDLPDIHWADNSSRIPIEDDWELLGAAGMKGFNGQAGGKGSIQYLLGFDRELVEKAQAHIPDTAERKRVKRKERLILLSQPSVG